MSTAVKRREKKRPRRTAKKSVRQSGWWAALSVLILLIVVAAIAFLLRGGYDTYVRSSFQLQYSDIVLKYAQKYDLPPSLIYGVIRTESNFDPDAESYAGAKGLMQLTETAVDWVQSRSDELDGITVEQLSDPEVNIHCGVYTLYLLSEMFEDEDTVIAAYNAGLGNVQAWLEDPAYSDDGVTLHTIPFEETRNYVQRVRSAQAIYQNYYHIDQTEGATD